MKKIRFIALALILALTMAIPAVADQVNVYKDNQLVKSVVFKIGVPYYVVNGQTPGVKMDVAPFIESDRTFVPVRFLGNALGLDDSKITWDNSTQTATLVGNATLQMTIGKAAITSNGVAKAIDVAPMLKSDRTFLPARFVAEGLSYQVGWDEATQTVVCWPSGQPQPDVSAAVDFLTNPNGQGTTPPVAGTKVNGYTVPANTNLKIADYAREASDGKWMVFWINLKKGNLDQQYADAESIVSQAVDSATTAKVMNYAKSMQDPILSPAPIDWPPTTTFNAPNKIAVRVGAGGGYSIEIQIWSTK